MGAERIERKHVRRALELALNGAGLAPPNPMVGAVAVLGDRVVGEGWHEGPGTPHAEIAALLAAGGRARGATLYVTLEPCSHHGRTPPCAPAVASAGIAEVVVGAVDPNPLVEGRGLAHLRDRGIKVRMLGGSLASEASDLIAGFGRHVTSGLPFVTLKMAASLDGKVAARDGSSRWISGATARQDVHRLRAVSGAIVVGAGTAMADDPSLTVRLDGFRGRPPLRVLVDGTGRTPASGAMFDRSAPTMVATTIGAAPSSRARWEAAGADVLVLDESASGSVSLRSLMQVLGKRDIQSVLMEGGPTLAWSAVEEGIVDRFVLYLAPRLIGGAGAPGILAGRGADNIAGAAPLEIRAVERLGPDVKVVADIRRGNVVHGDR